MLELSQLLIQNAPMLYNSPNMASEGSNAAVGIFVLAFYGIMCIFALVYFILQIYATLWVYRDCKKRGTGEETIWAIITVLFFPFGWLAYLLLGRK